MAKISPLMIAPPLIFAAFAALAYVGMYRDDPQGLPSTRVGLPAPAITEKRLADYPGLEPGMLHTGQVTLINFWASWCPPCRAEHPKLLEMAGQGIPIIGVNFKDQAGTAESYLDDDGNPFSAVAFDPQGRTAIEWGVTAPPETFIVDGDGVVLFRFAGPLVGSDYEQRFLPALTAAQAD
ncbi:DsbE family thiol:disulfide interchange protein [Puniceibacterium sp. IMCC21224]|uniref:DsbE family thiol:disulfide interchange protein n=1 Tax=Puniceibacterium sp. IMCC21224 TaxID=1618204 RepID=UPI00064DE2BD|nr:DsbE family thiol:disulfide interchange protein [Puniceibacterium sp. IMCC21224]KMK67202.1 periplasmic protein thiol:disulfide oxidoreductase, DsbE subfamily [Puniceibacterium sp. IMCC21224]